MAPIESGHLLDSSGFSFTPLPPFHSCVGASTPTTIARGYCRAHGSGYSDNSYIDFHPIIYYFFGAGGKCWNILFTPLPRFFVFLSALLESVSLDELRQINFSVFASKRSITKVPTV